MGATDREPVSLREATLLVKAETGVILERLEGMERAGAIQRAELARRLEELNHAHQNAQLDRGMFVRREVYDPWRDIVNQALTESRSNWKFVAGVSSLISSLITGGFLLLGRSMLHP